MTGGSLNINMTKTHAYTGIITVIHTPIITWFNLSFRY